MYDWVTATQQKLVQHCKSTIIIKKKRKESHFLACHVGKDSKVPFRFSQAEGHDPRLLAMSTPRTREGVCML